MSCIIIKEKTRRDCAQALNHQGNNSGISKRGKVLPHVPILISMQIATFRFRNPHHSQRHPVRRPPRLRPLPHPCSRPTPPTCSVAPPTLPPAQWPRPRPALRSAALLTSYASLMFSGSPSAATCPTMPLFHSKRIQLLEASSSVEPSATSKRRLTRNLSLELSSQTRNRE